MASNREAIPVRLDDDTIARLDEMVRVMEQRTGGAKVSRSEVMRVAIAKGLEVLEKKNR